MPNLSAPAVANVFLERHHGVSRLTQMQLQKLTYFAHGWNLAVNGAPLIDHGFQAWDYGPVSPDLYDHTKFFGAQPIPRLIAQGDENGVQMYMHGGRATGRPYRAALTPQELDVIDRVFARYGDVSAFQLSEMTHQPGTPWHISYRNGRNTEIPNELIRQHYLEIGRAVLA